MSACWRQTGKEAAGQRVFAVRRGGFKKNLGATAHTDSDRRLLWSVLPPCHLKPVASLLLYSLDSLQECFHPGQKPIVTHFLPFVVLLLQHRSLLCLTLSHSPLSHSAVSPFHSLPPSHVSLRLYRPPCSSRCKHLCSKQHFSVSHK